jgi:hypothetical protein
VLNISTNPLQWDPTSVEQFERVFGLIIDQLIAQCRYLENIQRGLFKVQGDSLGSGVSVGGKIHVFTVIQCSIALRKVRVSNFCHATATFFRTPFMALRLTSFLSKALKDAISAHYFISGSSAPLSVAQWKHVHDEAAKTQADWVVFLRNKE